MICPTCKSKCNCIDSRLKLKYGFKEPLLPKKRPVRERKYACNTCSAVYITQEYVTSTYFGKSLDKRVVQPSGKAAVLNGTENKQQEAHNATHGATYGRQE